MSVLHVLNAETVEVLLELIAELLHLSHVGREDAMHNPFAHYFYLLCREEPRKEVIVKDIKQLKCLRGVEVLLDVLVAVHLVDGRLGDDVIAVVEAVMLDVVAESRYK